MESHDLEILILRNPENILYISEYWPITGWSLLVFKRSGEASLIIPENSKVGMELSFETIASNNVCGEISYASLPTFKLIEEIWKVEIVDITNLIYELRSVKTEREIDKLRIANEIAMMGLEETRNFIKEGKKSLK